MFNKTLNRETILTTQNNGKYYDKKDINGRTEQLLHITAYKKLEYNMFYGVTVWRAKPI